MAESNIDVRVGGYIGCPDAVEAVGVFRRDAGDGDWQHVFAEHETHAVHVHLDDSSLVFAGETHSVWRNENYGASFEPARLPDPNTQIWSFLGVDTFTPPPT